MAGMKKTLWSVVFAAIIFAWGWHPAVVRAIPYGSVACGDEIGGKCQNCNSYEPCEKGCTGGCDCGFNCPGGGGDTSCFPAGSKVTLAGGRLKNIEDIKKGDRVMSLGENGTRTISTVEKLEQRIADNMCEIRLANGEVLQVTKGHPLATTDGWKAIDPKEALKESPGVPVTNLAVGDRMIKQESETEVMTFACRSVKVQTYNLAVDNAHTFYVNGFAVHNKSGSACPSSPIITGDLFRPLAGATLPAVPPSTGKKVKFSWYPSDLGLNGEGLVCGMIEKYELFVDGNNPPTTSMGVLYSIGAASKTFDSKFMNIHATIPTFIGVGASIPMEIDYFYYTDSWFYNRQVAGYWSDLKEAYDSGYDAPTSGVSSLSTDVEMMVYRVGTTLQVVENDTCTYFTGYPKNIPSFIRGLWANGWYCKPYAEIGDMVDVKIRTFNPRQYKDLAMVTRNGNDGLIQIPRSEVANITTARKIVIKFGAISPNLWFGLGNYNWMVRSTQYHQNNGSDVRTAKDSPVRSFVIACPGKGVPGDVTGRLPGTDTAPGTKITDSTPLLHWDAEPLADYYRVRVQKYDEATGIWSAQWSNLNVGATGVGATGVVTANLGAGWKRWQIQAVNTDCGTTALGAWSTYKYFNINLPPVYNGLVIKNYVTDTATYTVKNVDWDTNRAHICKSAISNESGNPRSAKFVVSVLDDNGSDDISTVQMRWKSVVYTMTLGTTGANVGATATKVITYADADNNQDAWPLEINVTDRSGNSTGWVNSGYSWKVWDCEVPVVTSRIYERTIAEVVNCTAGVGFQATVPAFMNFQNTNFHQNIGTTGDTTYGGLNHYSYVGEGMGSSLMWSKEYTVSLNKGVGISFGGSSLNMRWIGMSVGATVCGTGARTLDGTVVDPYQTTPKVKVDISAIAGANAEPAVSDLKIKNNSGTVVPWDIGTYSNHNHLCKSQFTNDLGVAPRTTAKFEVQVSDPDGTIDLGEVRLLWNGMNPIMTLGTTGVAILNTTATWTYDFLSTSSALPEEVIISVMDRKGVGTSLTGYFWKPWNCRVPVDTSMIYSNATDPIPNCATSFSVPADSAAANFTSIKFNQTNVPVTEYTFNANPDGITYSSGLGYLLWSKTYVSSMNPGFADLTPLYKWKDVNSTAVQCPNALQTLDDGVVDPYKTNPKITVDVSANIVASGVGASGWYQTEGGGVVARSGIACMIPQACTGACTPAISKASATSGDNSIISSGGSIVSLSACAFGTCNYGSPNDWHKSNLSILSPEDKLGYSYFKTKYFDALGEGQVLAAGESMSHVPGTGVVMVAGDFVIDTNKTINANEFFMVVASGNIIVKENVTELAGVYMADGNIDIGGTNATALVINGMLYGSRNDKNIRFHRGFVNELDNNNAPAVTVNFNPGLVFNMPGKLQKLLSGWIQY